MDILFMFYLTVLSVAWSVYHEIGIQWLLAGLLKWHTQVVLLVVLMPPHYIQIQIQLAAPHTRMMKSVNNEVERSQRKQSWLI
jgi:hypothetical protein